METLARRSELLRLEGKGFNQSEIMAELTRKYICSARTVQRDFKDRVKWQPHLLQLKDQDKIRMKILNRYEQIYRDASFMALKTSQENVKLGALNLKLKVTEKLAEVLLPSIQKVEVAQKEPFQIVMWKPENAEPTTRE